ESVSALLTNTYESLRSVDLDSAVGFLDKALALDFEQQETLFALKCAGFWTDRTDRIQAVQTPFERGEFILSQWKTFMSFLSKLSGDFEPARYAFRRFVFGLALREYLSVPEEERASCEADLEFRLGRCRKCCGDYDASIRHLETAARSRREDAATLAELADAYALSGEQRSSKALFREAFYLDPSAIDLSFLESEMITRLADRVAAIPVEGTLVAEWLPVYGNLYGVFTVRRELRQAEVGRLKQSIQDLERSIKDNPGQAPVQTPRLLNRYFWLRDHYEAIGEAQPRIDEILLKVRLLDQSIYKQYTA
ncbi:MAG: hypothetical protein Q8O19_07025, partial [Rectinemataceae bacterium]|nr:hypothetical protein [Rectinemataceae bacterium]